MAQFVKVDIKHSSGVEEKGHLVELAQHSRESVSQQIEAHLKNKYCGKIRGGWTYSNTSAAFDPKSVPAAKAPDAKPVKA